MFATRKTKWLPSPRTSETPFSACTSSGAKRAQLLQFHPQRFWLHRSRSTCMQLPINWIHQPWPMPTSCTFTCSGKTPTTFSTRMILLNYPSPTQWYLLMVWYQISHLRSVRKTCQISLLTKRLWQFWHHQALQSMRWLTSTAWVRLQMASTLLLLVVLIPLTFLQKLTMQVVTIQMHGHLIRQMPTITA